MVRDGILEHHKSLTLPETAVLHRLFNLAIRQESKGPVGLCRDPETGRRIGIRALASGMAKDRKTIRRAVEGLEKKRYIGRSRDGTF